MDITIYSDCIMRKSNFQFIPSLYAVFFLLVLLSSCSGINRGEWVIEDVSKDTLLEAYAYVVSPRVMHLEISGQTDDSINVWAIGIAGGVIDTNVSDEWYRRQVLVRYKPHKAKKGKLKIKYYIPFTI